MLYMIIERFGEETRAAMANRFREYGRMLPEGVEYRMSWMTPERDRCYQLMVAARREELDEWVRRWSDLVDFEIVPVIESSEY